MRGCKRVDDDVWHAAGQEFILRYKILVKGGFIFVALALEDVGIHNELSECFRSQLARRVLCDS